MGARRPGPASARSAIQIADAYRLEIAAELVAAMDAADAAADPYTRQFYEDLIAAVEGTDPS